MFKFVFPLSYKYSANYRMIASLMASPSFMLYVYTISFEDAFTRSKPCSYQLELVQCFVPRKNCGEKNTTKLYQEYPQTLGTQALARFSIVP